MPYCKNCWQIQFKVLLVVIITTISLQVYGQVFPVETIMENGERKNRINLVYLSDGYMSEELPEFLDVVKKINDRLFLEHPYREYKSYFNAFAIQVPSNESGAKHPGSANDEPLRGGEVIEPIADPDNYFQSTFDYNNIHRLLVPLNGALIYEVLAKNFPDYDQVIVVVNTPYYGGSGGVFSTTSIHDNSPLITIHEMGHSFANLADEYWISESFASERANMTQNDDESTIRWKNWLGDNKLKIGIFPYGNNAPASLWFRPHQDCRMRFLEAKSYCSVCKERIIDRIYEQINVVDSYAPSDNSFTLTNRNPVSFSIANVQKEESEGILINWYLNEANTPFARQQTNVTLQYNDLNFENNTIKAEVIDPTSQSRSYLPGAGYVNSITWTVNKPRVLPVHLINFSGKVNSNNVGLLNWEIDKVDDLKNFQLEKSNDGASFVPLATISGEFNKVKYTFSDPLLFMPHTYYRLKVVEKDGTSFFSNTIMLKNAFDKMYYKVYQNIEQHKYLVLCNLTNQQNILIKVVNAGGALVLSKDFGKVDHQLRHEVDLSGKPAGVYFLSLVIDNQVYTVQLIAK